MKPSRFTATLLQIRETRRKFKLFRKTHSSLLRTNGCITCTALTAYTTTNQDLNQRQAMAQSIDHNTHFRVHHNRRHSNRSICIHRHLHRMFWCGDSLASSDRNRGGDQLQYKLLIINILSSVHRAGASAKRKSREGSCDVKIRTFQCNMVH